MLKNFHNLFNWVSQNKKKINIILIVLIIIRFVFLNYINWKWGLLTSGRAGIQYGGDSMRYIDGVERLFNNTPFYFPQADYLGYIFFLAFIKIIGAGLEAALLFQLFFALISAYALYDITKSITKNKTAGIVASGLYLVNPFITTYHLYVLTESLYTSFLIFSVWSLYKMFEKKNYKYYILSFLIICITSSIRPNGWVLFPIFFYFIIMHSGIKRHIKYITFLIIILLFSLSAIFIPEFNKAIQNDASGENLVQGNVIWGGGEQKLSMPTDPSLENKNWTSAYSYVAKHPLACLKLAAYRVASETLTLNRPWMSDKFRIRFLLWVLPGYFLAIFGFIFFRKNIAVKIASVVILAQLLIISLTHADHDFRFILYILPLIYLLGSCGLLFFYYKIKTRIGKEHR
ncbi:MAG: glycosyltransferase family 39 protein [Bacteroidetes bacterium]|nr:glycosyltransferase family 39 protein [Bacteroidota bacterium]